jgi:hypothetical protein
MSRGIPGSPAAGQSCIHETAVADGDGLGQRGECRPALTPTTVSLDEDLGLRFRGGAVHCNVAAGIDPAVGIDPVLEWDEPNGGVVVGAESNSMSGNPKHLTTGASDGGPKISD